jgi:hypothetical protein
MHVQRSVFIYDGGDLFEAGRGRVYLTPIVILGAILAARIIPILVARPPIRRLQFASQAALAALAAGLLVVQLASLLARSSPPAWVRANPYLEVGQWLEAQGLVQGVGGYFDSSIIRALTNGKVAANAVSAEENGHLGPFLFDTDSAYYRGNPAPMFCDLARWRRSFRLVPSERRHSGGHIWFPDSS